ncbi:hypothetical protein [Martelella soudanensis]|uniref:hypothetical protein n=1 Tax=unclassified Martelella TaxID=2629616 RepID=UPI0015DF7F28|nr:MULTISPECIES: hypothetical protein [unclassified Martelella]
MITARRRNGMITARDDAYERAVEADKLGNCAALLRAIIRLWQRRDTKQGFKVCFDTTP